MIASLTVNSSSACKGEEGVVRAARDAGGGRFPTAPTRHALVPSNRLSFETPARSARAPQDEAVVEGRAELPLSGGGQEGIVP